MKRIIGLITMLTTLAVFSPAGAAAQTAKRLRFAKGKSSATVRGTTGSNGVSYELRVRGGQKMTLALAPAAKLGVRVERNGGGEVLLREERGGTFVLYFEEDGDVSIFVGSLDGRPVPFALSVKIARMTDI